MSPTPLASVIVDNYNYARYLPQAIESALAQTYPRTEVIVVDDGSTDGSREIIAGYGDRIRPVLKANGGQASAFNAGFTASRGDVLVFLDADDMLSPTAVQEAVRCFEEPGVVKVHWPLRELDWSGSETGRLVPEGDLPEGDLRELVVQEGPASHLNPPTSGNAWSRNVLERILPVPEAEYRIWADVYLLELAPLFGRIRQVSHPQGWYRVHGENRYASRSFTENLERGVRVYDQLCRAMSHYGRELGFDLDEEACRQRSWFHRISRSVAEIEAIVPPGAAFILVDGDQWGTDALLAGRSRLPFLERDGEYWGPPEDDEAAIRELERLRSAGAEFILFAWPAFWWLDYYAQFSGHLRSGSACRLENDRLIVFDLRSTQEAGRR